MALNPQNKIYAEIKSFVTEKHRIKLLATKIRERKELFIIFPDSGWNVNFIILISLRITHTNDSLRKMADSKCLNLQWKYSENTELTLTVLTYKVSIFERSF